MYLVVGWDRELPPKFGSLEYIEHSMTSSTHVSKEEAFVVEATENLVFFCYSI